MQSSSIKHLAPREIFFQTIHDYKGYKMDKIKDGHTDVASARRQCANIMEDCKDIINALPNDDEASLPTWWTNKLAVAAAYLNSDRDYLVYTMQQASNEEASAENTEDQTITIDFNADDDDMIPPSAKMVKESQNASEKG